MLCRFAAWLQESPKSDSSKATALRGWLALAAPDCLAMDSSTERMSNIIIIFMLMRLLQDTKDEDLPVLVQQLLLGLPSCQQPATQRQVHAPSPTAGYAMQGTRPTFMQRP